MLIADISSSVMNAKLTFVTKSKSHKKVAKMRYQTIIYRTNAEIAFLPPFGPGVLLPMSIDWLVLDRWHAIYNTCHMYST